MFSHFAIEFRLYWSFRVYRMILANQKLWGSHLDLRNFNSHLYECGYLLYEWPNKV